YKDQKLSRLPPYKGRQVPARGSSCLMTSSAARAALREQALLPHLFRASYACGITSTALFVRYRSVVVRARRLR
ncbi:hypothetical protein, partial [Pseudomonas sp. RIT-To-2]|uniref:hypothetical protein n=1 Tax=Pseudomonas sp. RIT-To-2 TaxID=3462541 RepID=UPI002413A53F